jgi:hypothetical protein
MLPPLSRLCVGGFDGSSISQEFVSIVTSIRQESSRRQVDVAGARDQDGHRRFALDQLPVGDDEVLGLNDDYAVGVDGENINSAVLDSIWSKVVTLCSRIRSHTAQRSSASSPD